MRPQHPQHLQAIKALLQQTLVLDVTELTGPNLQKVGPRLNAQQITNQIYNGGGEMPPFKGTLNDSEIAALTDWLLSHK